MDVNVVLEKDNSPLGRKEYTIELTFKGATPKRDEIKTAIVSKLGKDPSLIIIKKADQLTGRNKVRVSVYFYHEKNTLMRIEPQYILKREGLIEEKEEKKE